MVNPRTDFAMEYFVWIVILKPSCT